MNCAAPVPASEAHELKHGGRQVEIRALTVQWGDDDLRETWTGAYRFCSFKCLADWATAKASEHDQHILKEGKEPK